VKSVAPNSLAESLGIQPGFVVVSVNGADAERTNASGVAIYFSRAVEAALAARDGRLTLTFRDPSKFRKELENFPMTADNGGESSVPSVSTKVAPAGMSSSKPGIFDGEQKDQVITVSQLIPPKVCRRRATIDDLVEISYIGQVVETGAIFDGSAVKINGGAYQVEAMIFHSTLCWGSNRSVSFLLDGMLAWMVCVLVRDDAYLFRLC
jgi:hypothetical protein